MGQPRPLFCLFSFFSNTHFTEKTVGFCWIRTRFVGVEGNHADHLTTTTADSKHFKIDNRATKNKHKIKLKDFAAVVIAQWICLSPGFESQAQKFIFEMGCEKDENKQKDWPNN